MDTSQPLYVPCEVLRVRAIVATSKGLTPLEQLVIGAIGRCREPVQFAEVTEMFGLGERPTLDLVRDLWSAGHLAVNPRDSSIRLTTPTQQRLDAGKLEEVEGGRWEEEPVELLRELVTGHIIRSMRPLGRRTGYQVPEEVPPSGGRLTDAQQAEMSAIVSELIRRTFAGQPRELIEAIPVATPEGMAPERRVIRMRARVSRSSDGDALRFEIDRPTSMPARVRNHMAEQLGRSAQANPEAYVFRNIAARVPVTENVAGEPLEWAVERLRQACDALDGAVAEDVLHIHDECVTAVEAARLLLGAAASAAPVIEVVRGSGGFIASVRHAIQTARKQLVLVCPFVEWEGFETFQEDLIEAVQVRRVRLFVLWSSPQGEDINDRFARGLMQLRGSQHAATVLRSSRSANLHAKVIIRDADFAAVGSANFLGGVGGAAELGVTARSTVAGEPSPLVAKMLEWIWARMPDQSMRSAVEIPEIAVPEVRLPEIPDRPVMIGGLARDQRDTSGLISLHRIAWRDLLSRVEEHARELAPNCEAIVDEDHRQLLMRAIREARWRLLVSSDRLGDTGLDPSVERALRERLQEGLPVALVWRREREGAYAAALTIRLEELAAEFPSALSLVNARNHAKVLLWDDQVVISSFNFLSFRGSYEGARGRRPWGELGVRVNQPDVADRAVGELRTQLGGALDAWDASCARPETEPEEAGTSTSQLPGADTAARAAQRFLRQLLPTEEPTSRRSITRAFFDRAVAPGDTLDLIERSGALNEDDLHTARLCALRRREVRSHPRAAEWLTTSAERLWDRGDFFAAAALLGASGRDGPSVANAARLPTVDIALMASVGDRPLLLAGRLGRFMCTDRLLEVDGACALGVYAVARYGSGEVATALEKLAGPAGTVGQRLAQALLATWWSETMAAVPTDRIGALIDEHTARRELAPVREAALTAFRLGRSMRMGGFPPAAEEALESLFGDQGRLQPLIAAVERNDPAFVRQALREMNDAEALVQDVWAAVRSRAGRLENPLKDKLVRPTSAVLAALKGWAARAEPGSTTLQEYERRALDALGAQLDNLWPEVKAAALQPPTGVLLRACIDSLEPVVRWRRAATA
jgi:hypothetical protein